MTSSNHTKPFRFVDLPREIRDKIYRILLCGFGPRPTTITPQFDAAGKPNFMNEIVILDHTVDTTILLASKQVHREAYDTMVKANRFVRVTSSGGFPLRVLLNHLRVPVVTENEESVNAFKGYVLSVSMSCPKGARDEFQGSPFSIEPDSLMLLSRDMAVFCEILMDGWIYISDFGTKIALKIAVGPSSTLVPSSYKAPINDFFSENTQKALLQPFRERLRGFKKVKVRGLVDRSLAAAVEAEMAQNVASDPDAILEKYIDLKAAGQRLYAAKRTEEASLTWQDAALEIEQLLESSSWPSLTETGGVPFVAGLAETYFLMKLNIAHIKLGDMERGVAFADILASDALKMGAAALREAYWKPGFKWKPKDVHRAKLSFRYAVYFRLEGNPQNVQTAERMIGAADRLLPGDRGVEKEKESIAAWKASLR